MKDPTFWFTSLLTTVVLLLPVVAWRFYRSDVHPTLADRVRLLQQHSQIKPREEFRPFTGRRSRWSTWSGYAFTHTHWYQTGLKSGSAEWQFETYLVKFETYSVIRDYEDQKTTGAPEPTEPPSLAPMTIYMNCFGQRLVGLSSANTSMNRASTWKQIFATYRTVD